MDFFGQQDTARSNTAWLIILFMLGVVCMIALVHGTVAVCYAYLQEEYYHEVYLATGKYVEVDLVAVLLDWNLALYTSGATLGLILLGSLFKIIQLGSGGKAVAEAMGAMPVKPNSRDPHERRLINVVEEMALAAGTPVPGIYIMHEEQGINAFAAGYTSSDAVVAVTYGTMTRLNRDELQGVVAHEFSHIVNGDMRINIHLMGLLHGILLVALLGEILMRTGGRTSDRSRLVLFVGGWMLLTTGYLGLFFGRMIKAAVSREREYLADAAAVQFTRNPAGLVGALKKIGGYSRGSEVERPNAEFASHLFFASGIASLFSTHPPLGERILRIDPGWDEEYEILPDKYMDSAKDAGPAPALAGAIPEVPETVHVERYSSFGAPDATETVDVAETAALGEPAIAAEPVSPNLARAGALLEVPETVHIERYSSFGAPDVAESVDVAETAALGEPAMVTEPVSPGPAETESETAAPPGAPVDFERTLLLTLPDEILTAVQQPDGAQAVTYSLIVGHNMGMWQKHLGMLKESAGVDALKAMDQVFKPVTELDRRCHLPLIALCAASLCGLSEDRQSAFRQTLDALILCDKAVSPFEFALQRVLRHKMGWDRNAGASADSGSQPLSGHVREAGLLLSALACAGQDDPDQAEAAYRAGARMLEVESVPDPIPTGEIDFAQVGAALDQLERLAPADKKVLIAACAATTAPDGRATLDHGEILRAICDSLDVPMPASLPDGKPAGAKAVA